MKSTVITGTLAAISLAGVLATPAFAQNVSSATGAPAPAASAANKHQDKLACVDGFDPGDTAGVRICRTTDDGFRIVTTDPAKSGPHEYTGTLTTNGQFTDATLIRPEADDSITIDGSGNIVYDFKTYSSVDGADFHVTGAKQVTFNLSLDGQPMVPTAITIGDKKDRHPGAVPFEIRVEHKGKGQPTASPAPSASPSANG